MLKHHFLCVGLLCSVVACSSGDGSSSSSGAGGAFAASGGSAQGGGTSGGLGPSSSGGGPAMGSGNQTGGTAAIGSGGTGVVSASGGAATTGSGGVAGSTNASGGASTGGGASAGGGSGGSGGDAGTGTGGSAPSTCPPSSAPMDFQPDTATGGGGTPLKDSPHFRIYGSASASTVDTTLNHLEAAYACFVEDWCFRTTGLPVQKDTGPYTKTNIYATGSLGSAAGLTQEDFNTGLSYIQVISSQMALPRVTVHEYGHALTISEYFWVDQKRTGAWWETVGNWVADTYLTSTYCDEARTRFGVAAGDTLIDLTTVISQSNLLIVSTQNYYQAWPFLTYLTMNLDGYPGLGKMAVLDLMRNHTRMNETPLHVLEKIASPVKVQTILGRYWARMAYLDIGHPKAQAAFLKSRGSLNFANLDSMGSQTYKVKSTRQPAYGGANIIPLEGTGDVTVQLQNLGNGLPESNFTATLSIRASDGTVRYVDLPNGTGHATVANTEEATLVVANTPDTLYQYDAFSTTASSPESIGLNYQVKLTGVTPAN